MTGRSYTAPGTRRSQHRTGPVLVSRCGDVSGLAEAAAEVAALRAVLKDEDVTGDWVAKAEVGERLAAAESILVAEFDRAYGADTHLDVRGGRDGVHVQRDG